MRIFPPLHTLPVPDPQDPRPLVIYHGNDCPDGFAAALAAWLFYTGQAEFLALDHGDVRGVQDLPDVSGRAVYILDFAFANDILRAIEAQAAKLVLLDHHQSAAEQLTGFTCRCGGVHFDLRKSGARLAWEYFLPSRPLPDLVRYVEDRDIWTWQYPDSAAYLAALDMEIMDFARWAELLTMGNDQQAAFLARGQAMDDKFNQLVRDMADAALPIVFNGERGLMINATSAFHSALGHFLSERSGTFALLWCVTGKGVVKVGLRSQPTYDCIPLARSMGGGGHPQASAFRMPVQRLPELLGGVFVATGA